MPRRRNQIILSAGERQSREVMEAAHVSGQLAGDLLVEDLADGEGDDHPAALAEEAVDLAEGVARVPSLGRRAVQLGKYGTYSLSSP